MTVGRLDIRIRGRRGPARLGPPLLALAALAGGVALVLAARPWSDHWEAEFRLLTPYDLLLTAALIALAIGTYIIWPSRWNIPAHLQLGFSLAAYVAPILLLRVTAAFPAAAVREYAWICTAGAVALLAGMLVGDRLGVGLRERLRAPGPPRAFTLALRSSPTLRRRVLIAAALALAGIALSTAVMGFVPAFAANPFDAKFFRGDYQAAYRPVAPLFRLSQAVIVALVPVLFAVWWVTRRLRYLVPALAILLVLGLFLQRQQAASGILLFLGLLAARRGGRFAPYLVLVALVYPFGAAVYHLLGELPLMPDLASDAGPKPGLLELVGSGAPDVSDQLLLFDSFVRYGELTGGRTFYGGLVPFSYEWNPAVWTLTTVSPAASVTDIASGGFRLPAPLWGYTAFGWPGAVAVPALSGVFIGMVTRWARENVVSDDIERSTLVLLVYTGVLLPLAGFYALSYLAVFTLMLAAFLVARRPSGPGLAMDGATRPRLHKV